MARCPCEADHARIKRRELEVEAIGAMIDDFERIELVNCPHCHTTLGRPFADSKHAEENGKPLCGMKAEGAFLVEDAECVDCPLCHTVIVERSN